MKLTKASDIWEKQWNEDLKKRGVFETETETEFYKKAYSRVMNDEASKVEIEVLLEWATDEIKQWKKFQRMCKEQLKGK